MNTPTDEMLDREARGRPHGGRNETYPDGCECDECEAYDELVRQIKRAEDAGWRYDGDGPGDPPYDLTVIPAPGARWTRFRASFFILPRVGYDCAAYIIHPKPALP